MVYESDFYTNRRPYSSRPNVSSYSVTSRLTTLPTVTRVHTYTVPIYTSYPSVYHHSIPWIAHKRLVTGTRCISSPTRVYTRAVTSPIRSVTPVRYVSPLSYISPVPSVHYPFSYVRILSTPAPTIRTYSRCITSPIRTYTRCSTSPLRTISFHVRPSILYREYNRIENLPRSSPHHSYTESYLNSDACKKFDDEARDIRNETQSLLRKVHHRVQRSHSVLPTSYSAKFERRYGPDSFVSSLSGPLKSTTYNGLDSYDPNKYIGKSHLACIRVVGNKAYNTRRATTCFDDDKVRNDVNLLSYYLKNRKAAEAEPKLVETAKLKEAIEGPLITEVAAY